MRRSRTSTGFFFAAAVAALLHHPRLSSAERGEDGRRALSLFSRCGLKCWNGGRCEIGPQHEATAASTGGKGQYCHCPTGYTGTHCEIKFVLCPEGINGTCFNDAPCIRDIDDGKNEFYRCQCDQVESDLSEPYATKLCEHSASTFCKPEDDHNSLGPTGDSYCANSGKCKPPVKGKHHAGCDCAPGWSGAYCEIADSIKGKVTETNGKAKAKAKAAKQRASSNSGWNRLKRFLLAFFSFLIVFGTVAFVCLLYEHGRSGRRRVRGRRRQQRGQQQRNQRSSRYLDRPRNAAEERHEEEEEDEEEDMVVLAEQEMTPVPKRSSRGGAKRSSSSGEDKRSRGSATGELA